MRLSYDLLEWRTFPQDPEASLPEGSSESFYGQERAREALEAALRTGGHGYLVGPPGLGKKAALFDFLKHHPPRTPPPDQLYLPLSPSLVLGVLLPAGQGWELQRAASSFLAERQLIQGYLEQMPFLQEKYQLEAQFNAQQRALLEKLAEEAKAQGFTLERTEEGLRLSGPQEPSPDLKARLEETVLALMSLAHRGREALGRLRYEWAAQYLEPRLRTLCERYPTARPYWEALHRQLLAWSEAGEYPQDVTPWQAHLLLGAASQSPPPVIYEPLPTPARLCGRLEYRSVEGGLFTHVGLIRPGALHKAQGGFLVLDAIQVWQQGSWPYLKRALKNGEIELFGEEGNPKVQSLEVLPMPLQTQVFLVGTPEVFHLLEHDEDFAELFRFRAEFSPVLEANPQALRFLGNFVQSHGYPLRQGALAALYDHARRSVEHRQLLDARLGELLALAREARALAPTPLTREAVLQAIRLHEARSALSEEHFLREVQEGTWSFQLQGRALGQVNGLVILEADPPWGRPVRITARASAGREGVVSIDREAGLTGQVFHKAALTLEGYLRGHYAEVGSLAVTASVVFEQNYGHIEGDSAGLAELLAILSAIGGFPLRQDLAVTGAVDQLGNVLAVGGVTPKVEGFYRICKAVGLTGSQGVVLPKSNLVNLTLSEEVLQAVKAGQFHLYAVSQVDEALELFTGLKKGFRGAHERVRAALEEFQKLEEGQEEADTPDRKPFCG
ncbi:MULTISPECIES: AAA family ATPase [unclassified Meiothermus]|uniref:AAA family ATPase n=1 Tax=unclassified Meiothermus TaxID=370471 RepID=UPI000D7CC4F0|nr:MULTISPECIES: AAA family ATPase [unclassified Meiothermus]PZA07949.1 peptidase S16 [Meiothermus sp. Pnk-1]RYM36706.1 peptidase S16 [Meiothermus sp. PNK-Is4]